MPYCFPLITTVATREGGVDRNIYCRFSSHKQQESPPARVAWIEMISGNVNRSKPVVATREGGVDRNVSIAHPVSVFSTVATREGGVDRNVFTGAACGVSVSSPPARVAWIEIWQGVGQAGIGQLVATREGGVDRNTEWAGSCLLLAVSPPARVAWIEISTPSG